MNIQTVAENLRNTIDGKEKYLATLKVIGRHGKSTGDPEGARLVRSATSSAIEYLEISIDELKRILQDVESCVAKDVEQSWRDNPDRSGGQFTQEEIDNATRWN